MPNCMRVATMVALMAGLTVLTSPAPLAAAEPSASSVVAKCVRTEEMDQRDQWCRTHLLDPQAKRPLSFVYGGQPAEKLLAEWPRKLESKKLDAARTQHNIDDEVGKGHWSVIRGWLELVKSHNLPAGMATHGATTHLEAEERDLPTDFYHQTIYRPDNYVRAGLEESLNTIAKLEKPVVGYKVLGAGRVKPADTLPYVFRHLKRKDGICVGVFPSTNADEIAENVALTKRCTLK